MSNLIFLDSYIYSDEKRECIPKCDRTQYWKEESCYLLPYYEVSESIKKKEKDIEHYFSKKLESYKEKAE
jgi:hypothetical protein